MMLSPTADARRVLYAAMDDWPPFIIDTDSVSSDSGFDGIDQELLQELSARTGIAIYPLHYPFARALQDMQSGRVDIMTSLAKTPERARYIGYLSTSYYQCHTAFYALPAVAMQIQRYEDLYGKKIGFVRGSAYFEPFDSDSRLIKNGASNENQLPGKVLKQRNQLFIGADCQVEYALQSMGLTGKIVPTRYDPEKQIDLYIGYSKAAGIEKEAAALDKALGEMVAEGWVAKLINSYLTPGGTEKPDESSLLQPKAGESAEDASQKK